MRTLIIILIFVGIFLCTGLFFFLKKNQSNFSFAQTRGDSGCDKKKKFKGMCLFDIDGTLTTGQENEKIVDKYLSAGYAVGICTAGSIYSPDNIKNFSWCPKNLYNFMKRHKFDTFNNVASNILHGKYNPVEYRRILDFKPPHIFWPGWLKGHALKKTARKYGISKSEQMVLLDNDPDVLLGSSTYDPNFTLICAGEPCGGELTAKVINPQN